MIPLHDTLQVEGKTLLHDLPDTLQVEGRTLLHDLHDTLQVEGRTLYLLTSRDRLEIK
jgi:hypothetical protein